MVVEGGPTWTIAVNLNQNLLGKTMIVLNRRCRSVTDLTPAEWTDLHAQIRRLRVALHSLFEPDQYNYAFLMNRPAGPPPRRAPISSRPRVV